jgi:hypothetical protein
MTMVKCRKLITLSAQQNTLKQSINNTSKELRQANKEANVVSGSLNEQRLILSQLKKEYANLDKSTEQGKKRADALAASIDNLNNEIKEAEQSTGDFRRNVGNYANGVKEALQSNEAFNGVLGDTLNAVQVVSQQVGQLTGFLANQSKAFAAAQGAQAKFIVGLKALRLALVGLGIGAIIAAFGALVAFLTRTEKGARVLAQVTAVLEVAFAKVADAAAVLGEVIFNAITEPQKALNSLQQSALGLLEPFKKVGETISEIAGDPVKAIEDLGNAIKENLLNRLDALGLFSDAISKALKGDFADAAKTAADGVIQLNTGITNGTDKLKDLGNSIIDTGKEAIDAGKAFATDFADGINKTVDAGLALEASNRRLKNTIRETTVEIAKQQNEAEKARKQRDDETKDITERIALNEEVLKAEEARTVAQTKNVEAQIALIQNRRKIQGRLSEEEKDELSQLTAELFFIREDFEGRTTEVLTEGVALRRELAIQEATAVKAGIDAQLLSVTEGSAQQLALRKQQAEAIAELSRAELDAEAINAEQKAQRLKLIDAELAKALLDIDKEAQAKRLENDIAAAEARTLALTEEQRNANAQVNQLIAENEDVRESQRAEQLNNELNFLNAKLEQELAAENLSAEQRLLIQSQYQQQAAQLNADFLADFESNKRAEQQISQAAAQTELDNAAAVAGALGQGAAAFKENTIAFKALSSAQAVISTFLAANKALAEVPFPANIIAVTGIVASGLANVAKINGVEFAEGGQLSGPSHQGGGVPGYAPGFGYFEAEGGEYITNKRATANNIGALRTINALGANQKFSVVPMFANGGQLSTANALNSADNSTSLQRAIASMPPPVVSVSEINKVNNRVSVAENTATI